MKTELGFNPDPYTFWSIETITTFPPLSGSNTASVSYSSLVSYNTGVLLPVIVEILLKVDTPEPEAKVFCS